MKVYMITDVEGVAGVVNWREFGRPTHRHYECCRRLTTGEINAAVDGLFAGGATEVLVDDAHGRGGIDPELLDPRALYLRKASLPKEGDRRMRMMDESFDALTFVGQHPKSGTEYGHLCHTGSFSSLEVRVNGVAVGEFGARALCANELGVATVFLSGDQAACREAEDLFPGIVTAAVKYGLTPGTGDELGPEAYATRNETAIHFHPRRARALIREGAQQAMERLAAEPGFGRIDFPPPYRRVERLRATDAAPVRETVREHPTSLIPLCGA